MYAVNLRPVTGANAPGGGGPQAQLSLHAHVWKRCEAGNKGSGKHGTLLFARAKFTWRTAETILNNVN